MEKVRLGGKCEINIEKFWFIEYEGMGWIHLAQEWVQVPAPAKPLKKFRSP